MKHVSLTCLLLFGLLGTFLLPLGIFQMQDYLHLEQYKTAQSNTYETFTQYPIISQIYAATYEHDTQSFYESYNLSDLTQYTGQVLEDLTQSKQHFETQLNELIDSDLLTAELLLSTTKNIQLEYGYLSHMINDQSLTMNLYQVNSIVQEEIKSQRFTYLNQADKIIQFEVMNDRIKELSEEERKQITWNMITYLGLSKIDDWTYLDHGYESYKAKLQVYCHIYTPPTGYRELQVGVFPLGQSNAPYILPQ